MPSEISAVLDIVLPLLNHIDLLLFDRGFYSKDLIMGLNGKRMDYLIFVPKNPHVKKLIIFHVLDPEESYSA